LCGLAAAGFFYLLLSLVVKLRGSGFVSRIFPPIVTGPVIMVIGLILAPVAVHMAMGRTGDGSAVLVPQQSAMLLSGIALLVTILASLFGKGLIRLIPILCGLVAGYLVALLMGLVDFSPVAAAPWFAMPDFAFPTWSWEAIFFMLPVAIAPALEHFGDVLAISSVSGKNFLKDPGIHRTLLGDGLATSMAAMLGGPPNTTYSEVTGAVALTRMFNPVVMTWAAVTAIILAFVGKVGAILQTVPVPVMGGIMVLLFGAIAVVGLNTLVRAGDDLMLPRNLAIVALTIVSGMGGLKVEIGHFALQGIGLAGILAVVLNLLLPTGSKEAAADLPDPAAAPAE
jgi:uracil permease